MTRNERKPKWYLHFVSERIILWLLQIFFVSFHFSLSVCLSLHLIVFVYGQNIGRVNDDVHHISSFFFFPMSFLPFFQNGCLPLLEQWFDTVWSSNRRSNLFYCLFQGTDGKNIHCLEPPLTIQNTNHCVFMIMMMTITIVIIISY